MTKTLQNILDITLERSFGEGLDPNNSVTIDYPRDKCVHQIFEECSLQSGEKVALIYEDNNLTYKDLNQKANQLANYLKKHLIKKGDFVGILLPKGFDLIISILAVLKLGATYVPLDPALPEERIDSMLNLVEVKALITDTKNTKILQEFKKQEILLDQITYSLFSKLNLNLEISPQSLAYVIFTSGSTGSPKGVGRAHYGIVNRVSWMWQICNLSKDDIYAQQANISVIDFGWEIFGTLLIGATLVLYEDLISKNVKELLTILSKYNVTRITLVPTLIKEILALDSSEQNLLKQSKVKYWQITGEALSKNTLEKFYQLVGASVDVTECYGTTEATSTIYKVYKYIKALSQITQISCNTRIYILDEFLNNVSNRDVGDLYVSGPILATGYINKPRETAESFIPNPFYKEHDDPVYSRLYKTGDLAQYFPDGNIELLGRKDYQVKINGYRVELQEIEHIIESISIVKQSAVVEVDNKFGTKSLRAYIILQADNYKSNSLIEKVRDFCKRKLPHYMQPSQIVLLDSLPLTPNGKVDRKRLSIITGHTYQQAYEIPHEGLESKIAQIWHEVLKQEKIGRHDDFFQLGGDSLRLVYIISRIMRELDVKLKTADIYQRRTIQEIAEYIAQKVDKNRAFLSNAAMKETSILLDAKMKKEIPLIANRYSYFLKKKSNLTHWFVKSFILKSQDPINIKLVRKSLNFIIDYHDILKLHLFIEKGKLRQHFSLCRDRNSLIYRKFSSIKSSVEFEEYVQKEVNRLPENIHFPNSLFKLILIKNCDTQEYIFFFLFHHILSDAYSLRILINDFFDIYQQYSQKRLPTLPDSTTSFREYCRENLTYLQSIEEEEYEYWQSLPWNELKPLNFDYPKNLDKNIEKFTYNQIEKLPINNLDEFVANFHSNDKHKLVHNILCAIAKAFKSWMDQDYLCLDFVFHGREAFIEGIDLTRTVGWISETVPLILPTTLSHGELLNVIAQQLDRVTLRGRSYHYLKHLAKNTALKMGMQSFFEPQISFNFIVPSSFDYKGIVTPADEYKPSIKEKETTERIYYLRGGSFFKKDNFYITWNYSNKIFENKSVENFTQKCMSEFKFIMDHLNVK